MVPVFRRGRSFARLPRAREWRRSFPPAVGGASTGTSPGLSCAAGAEGGSPVAVRGGSERMEGVGGCSAAGLWRSPGLGTLTGESFPGGAGIAGRLRAARPRVLRCREHVCVRVFI